MAPHRARAYAVCILCTFTAMFFLLTGVFPMKVPLYFPLARRWGLSAAPGELSMDFYGRSLLALLAGGAAAALGYGILRAVSSRRGQKDDRAGGAPGERPGASRGLLLWMAYAATALLLCASLYGYKLYSREPAPEPLPGWYVPR